jgi:membrane protease subunit HflC
LQAAAQVDRVTRSDVREEVGKRTFAEVVTTARGEVMKAITDRSAEELAGFGIEVREVRISRTELPKNIEENVYARMRTERERLARKYRAEGDEQGRRVRAEADREARVTVAEATRESSELRGVGDAESARIYADAHSTAPEFYGFVRRLEAYRKTIGAKTTLVVSPENEFFELLGKSRATP